jgi:hypothetical protein
MAFLFLHNIYVQNGKKRHSLEKVLKTGGAILNGQKKKILHRKHHPSLMDKSSRLKFIRHLINYVGTPVRTVNYFFYFYSFGVLQKKNH